MSKYVATNVTLTKEQLEWLQRHVMERKLKGNKGLTQAQVIREALEIYRERNGTD